MRRIPRTLFTLVVSLALALQTTVGSACAIGCLLGTCGMKPAAALPQSDAGAVQSCCASKKPASDTNDRKAVPESKSRTGQKGGCDCPSVSNGAAVAPATIANLNVAGKVLDQVATLPTVVGPSILVPLAKGPGHYGNDSGPPGRSPISSPNFRAPPVA